MRFNDVTPTIFTLSSDQSLSFTDKCSRIVSLIEGCTFDDILEHLTYAGVIPECFGHDSSEEKLFAKYCDALLAASLRGLGLKASVIEERADAADVIGEVDGYHVVGDAKAFRLSRTAKNQKDFKVEALDKWRKGAEYACLLSPLYQYPNSNSQIYLQASQYNVTLLSYTHLGFLLQYRPQRTLAIKDLWEVGKNRQPSKDAASYWRAVQDCVLKITGRSVKDWHSAVEKSRSTLPALADEQIAYWEQEKKRIEHLTHTEAKRELLEALKIESKIDVIRKNFSEAEAATETFD